jgi:hypothetical protein
MLYRLLRPDENCQDGLSATNPNVITSVFNHVINGSSMGWKSPYISTCGSLNSVFKFRSKTNDSRAQIVQISEDNLPVLKTDLRTWSNRRKHYVPGVDTNASINRFNNFARVYEEMLLVGYVPRTHVQLMNESDFDCEELPE